MSVWASFVRMVEHVWMELIAMSVVVQMDSKGLTVRIVVVTCHKQNIFSNL